ncbi:AAA family ATPase, partial [Rubrivirga sp.]|uniref:AAA family ATPase n=1 Tax=Rubrivirga sp. TaxID=1885344 RepID=UPI003C7282C2
LRAMNPVAVMIDEADAALGDRSSSGDSGVSSRGFGQIAQAMSDTRFRGKIIWFLVTARPDLMPVDLKRQGRAEEHIGLFYPSTRQDREELLRVMMRKTGVEVEMDAVPEALVDGERTYSGADMEALLTRAKFRAATHALDEDPDLEDTDDDAYDAEPIKDDALEGDAEPPPSENGETDLEDDAAERPAPEPAAEGAITKEILDAVVEDFVPPSYPLQVELQNLVAVMECTSRSMLPERFRGLEREATVRRVAELKRLLGER